VIDPTTGEMWNGFPSYLIEYSDTFLGREKSRQGKQGKYGKGEQRWSGFYLLLPHNLNVLYVCFSLHCSAFFFLSTSSALYGRYCKVGVSKNVLQRFQSVSIMVVSWCGYLRAVRGLCEGEHFNPWPFLRLLCVPCLGMPCFCGKGKEK